MLSLVNKLLSLLCQLINLWPFTVQKDVGVRAQIKGLLPMSFGLRYQLLQFGNSHQHNPSESLIQVKSAIPEQALLFRLQLTKFCAQPMLEL